MNYELAKELKDAGFPQTWREGMDFYWTEDRRLESQSCSDIGREADARDRGIKVPSLSEMIEACGDYMGDLTMTEDGWSCNVNNVGNNPQSDGKTPKEAVARLWLSLNKPIDSPGDK